MKKGIHPEYKKAIVSCACGNTFETRSTIGDIKVEICSNCHPFFTGKQKLIDTAGRVEKYMKKYKLDPNKEKAKTVAKGIEKEKPETKKAEMKKAEPEKRKTPKADKEQEKAS